MKFDLYRWRLVDEGDWERTEAMRIPGGTLYRTIRFPRRDGMSETVAMVFVPEERSSK